MEIELYVSDINQEFAKVAGEAADTAKRGPNPYYDGHDYAVPPLNDDFLFREEAFGGLIYDRRTGKVYKFGRTPYEMVKFLRINGALLPSRDERCALLGILFPKVTNDDVAKFFATLGSLGIGHLVEKC